jgi:hypothetical protein
LDMLALPEQVAMKSHKLPTPAIGGQEKPSP